MRIFLSILQKSSGKEQREKAGIDKRFFDRYYAGRNQAVAYKLKNITEYEMPKELKDYGISRAPQSFQYVK